MNPKEKVVSLLKEKSSNKQKVYRNTLRFFEAFKEQLKTFEEELKADIAGADSAVKISYTDQGNFEARFTFSGDVLVFMMHSNVFAFDPKHSIHQLSYVKKDPLAAYCGVIHIYNFLSDSFKYHRYEDVGTLIARIFINKDDHFFVEGSRQFSFKYNDFTNEKLEEKTLKEIIITAVNYALEYDLYNPPMQVVSEIAVSDVLQLQSEQRNRTAKRLGFKQEE